jgi:outer membrane protein OmpA-like peptidoglycan-associated protein
MTNPRFGSIAASLVAAMVLSACAGHALPQPQHEGASPHPDCASFTTLLYFDPDSADLLPSATPILRDVARRIETCRAAGGELTRITVTAFPDTSGNRQERQSEINVRASTARDGLVAAGVDRAAIVIRRHTEAGGQLMQRRAEVAVELW